MIRGEGWRDGERFRRGMRRPYRTREICFGVTWGVTPGWYAMPALGHFGGSWVGDRADGANRTNGANGANGANRANRADGADGADGGVRDEDGTDPKDGANRTNGANRADGGVGN
jgi:hypothetical protein